MASFRLLLNDGCEGSRRHILLGHFPIPLFTLESESDRDAMITLFWPQRGRTRSQIRASSDTGSSRAVLLGSEKRVALGLGHPGLGDWKNSSAAPAPFRTWSPEPGCRRGGCELWSFTAAAEYFFSEKWNRRRRRLFTESDVETYGHLGALCEGLSWSPPYAYFCFLFVYSQRT